MATIYNSDLFKELTEGAKLQVSRETIPTQIAEKVVPVMEVNPKLLRRSDIVRRITATNTVSSSILVIPSDKEFYLTGVMIGLIKDATSTSLYSGLTLSSGGVTRELIIPGFTLTAQNEQTSISFTFPVKVDSGTTMYVVNSTNVANCTCTVTIFGYFLENIRA